MTNGIKLNEKNLPEQVAICECWARDGLQNEVKQVSTDDKVEMIEKMVAAGIKVIEATTFAHPKFLPQFADAEEVLRRIPRGPDLVYRGGCFRPKAVERALRSKEQGYGVEEIGMAMSASELHNQANTNMTHAENRKILEGMIKDVLDTGHALSAWVLTAFGCPIQGDMPIEPVIEMGKWWLDMGATTIGFGDTTGSSNPRQVADFYERIFAEGFKPEQVVSHFHDTRGWGVANTLVSLTYGVGRIETSLGAIGGQPKTGAARYDKGFTGNTCTEDLVGMLDEMGVSTGIDIEKMLEAGHRAEEILERRLRSNFLSAGPVPHGGLKYDKEKGLKEE